MLWLKGWFEVRWRFLFALGMHLAVLAARYTGGVSGAEDARRMAGAFAILLAWVAIFLAGSGVKTQSPFQGGKGLHGSIHFTLALPVSRLRLLAVRSGVGLLGTAVICVVVCSTAWALFPLVRGDSNPADLMRFILTVFLCSAWSYTLSALFATFLDEIWQIWGCMIVFGLLFWLSMKLLDHSPFNIFQAMGVASPLITHTFPWVAIAVSLGVAAILFFAAWRVVETREY